MHAANELRRSRGKVSAAGEAEKSESGELCGGAGEGRAVHFEVVLKERVERLRPGIKAGILEELPADVFVEAKNFKQVAVAIARESRDSHAGKHLSQAAGKGFSHLVKRARFLLLCKLFGK